MTALPIALHLIATASPYKNCYIIIDEKLKDLCLWIESLDEMGSPMTMRLLQQLLKATKIDEMKKQRESIRVFSGTATDNYRTMPLLKLGLT